MAAPSVTPPVQTGTPALNPEQELSKLQSDQSYGGGTYYGRTPGGIADLTSGKIIQPVGANQPTPTGSDSQGNPGTWSVGADGKNVFTPDVPTVGATIAGSGVTRYAPPQPTTDPNVIRQAALASVAAEVQGYKDQYAKLIQGAQDEGELAGGKQRSISARSGVLGSDFGNSAEGKVRNDTEVKVDDYNTKMNAAISAAVSKANTRADTLIKQGQNLDYKNSKDYQTQVEQNQKSARDDIATLAKGGVPLESLDPTERNTLTAHSGLSESAFKQYYNANLPENIKTAAAASQSNVDQGILGLVSQGESDPTKIFQTLTSQGLNVTASQVASALKAINTTSSKGDSLKYSQTQISKMLAAGIPLTSVQGLQDYYNGRGDVATINNLSLEQQNAVHDIMNGTKTGGGSKGYTSGSLSYTSDTLSKFQAKLDASKGTDHYVDPDVYLAAHEAWVADGGLSKDFIKNFPPKSYVNPANTSLPAYLSSKTASSKDADIAGQINALFQESTPTK